MPLFRGKVQVFWNNSNKSNYIHEEIKSGLNSGDAWYRSVQSLSSDLLSKT
jgi:hypothetical protein